MITAAGCCAGLVDLKRARWSSKNSGIASFKIHSYKDQAMPAASKATKQNKAAHTAPSRPGCPDTPPESPTAQLSNPLEFARLVIDTVKLIQTSDSKETSPVAGSQVQPNAQDSAPIARASKLEVKEVHEV